MLYQDIDYVDTANACYAVTNPGVAEGRLVYHKKLRRWSTVCAPAQQRPCSRT